MKCPNCQVELKATAVVCTECDAVVDPSAFDDSPRPASKDARRPRKANSKSGVKSGVAKAKRLRRGLPRESEVMSIFEPGRDPC